MHRIQITDEAVGTISSVTTGYFLDYPWTIDYTHRVLIGGDKYGEYVENLGPPYRRTSPTPGADFLYTIEKGVGSTESEDRLRISTATAIALDGEALTATYQRWIADPDVAGLPSVTRAWDLSLVSESSLDVYNTTDSINFRTLNWSPTKFKIRSDSPFLMRLNKDTFTDALWDGSTGESDLSEFAQVWHISLGTEFAQTARVRILASGD